MKIARNLVEVGVYPLGYSFIRLYVVPNSANGSVEFLPEDKGLTQITVGVAMPWGESVAVLLHEAYEKTLIDLNTRYKLKPSFSGESSDYSFFMTHNQLGEAHEQVGDFLVQAYDDFRKAWQKEQKFTKKKK